MVGIGRSSIRRFRNDCRKLATIDKCMCGAKLNFKEVDGAIIYGYIISCSATPRKCATVNLIFVR